MTERWIVYVQERVVLGRYCYVEASEPWTRCLRYLYILI